MSEGRYYELIRFVRESTGDNVRGVVRRRGDSVDVLYSRDDVDMAVFKSRIELATKQAVSRHRYGGDHATLGVTDGHVELFDDVVVIYLQEGPDEGIVVSIDADLAGKLSSFVEECREVLGTDDDRSNSA